jgi:hypothetical protein
MMEMAHIELEAALETSNKWNITSAPLLRWQNKLKLATQECDHSLRRCRSDSTKRKKCSKWYRAPPFLGGLLILLCHLFRQSLAAVTMTS